MDNQHKTLGNKELIEQISAERLDGIISGNVYTIIDVRSQKGIETQGSIPSAINLPFDLVENAVDRNHKDYDSIFDREGPFLFCCTGGVMSYMAALKAQEKGLKNICNLEGGHAAWSKLKEAQV